jgi:hypothetical protein
MPCPADCLMLDQQCRVTRCSIIRLLLLATAGMTLAAHAQNNTQQRILSIHQHQHHSVALPWQARANTSQYAQHSIQAFTVLGSRANEAMPAIKHLSYLRRHALLAGMVEHVIHLLQTHMHENSWPRCLKTNVGWAGNRSAHPRVDTSSAAHAVACRSAQPSQSKGAARQHTVNCVQESFSSVKDRLRSTDKVRMQATRPSCVWLLVRVHWRRRQMFLWRRARCHLPRWHWRVSTSALALALALFSYC